MSAREDLALIQEHLTLAADFQDAKARRGTDEWDEDDYRAKKAALSAHRALWRGVREYVTAVREQEWADAQAALDAEEAPVQ